MLLFKELCFCFVLPCAVFVQSVVIFKTPPRPSLEDVPPPPPPPSSKWTQKGLVFSSERYINPHPAITAEDIKQYNKDEEERAVNGPIEEMSEDEGYIILEETLTQLMFLMDSGDLNETEAFGLLTSTPIMRAIILPDVLNETTTNEEYEMENGYEYHDEDEDYSQAELEGEEDGEEDKESAMARAREKRGVMRVFIQFFGRLTRGLGPAARRIRTLVSARLRRHGLLRRGGLARSRSTGSIASTNTRYSWSNSNRWTSASSLGHRRTLRARIWSGLKKTMKYTGVGLASGAGYIALDAIVGALAPANDMEEVLLRRHEEQLNNTDESILNILETRGEVEAMKEDLRELADDFRQESNDTNWEMGALFDMHNDTLNSLEAIQEDLSGLFQTLFIEMAKTKVIDVDEQTPSSKNESSMLPPTQDGFHQELLTTLTKLTDTVNNLADKVRPTYRSAYLMDSEQDPDAEWLSFETTTGKRELEATEGLVFIDTTSSNWEVTTEVKIDITSIAPSTSDWEVTTETKNDITKVFSEWEAASITEGLVFSNSIPSADKEVTKEIKIDLTTVSVKNPSTSDWEVTTETKNDITKVFSEWEAASITEGLVFSNSISSADKEVTTEIAIDLTTTTTVAVKNPSTSDWEVTRETKTDITKVSPERLVFSNSIPSADKEVTTELKTNITTAMTNWIEKSNGVKKISDEDIMIFSFFVISLLVCMIAYLCLMVKLAKSCTPEYSSDIQY